MNKVCLAGNIGKDPEIRFDKEGKAIANFSLATKGYKDSTDWHRCVAFGKTAEIVQQYVGKGSTIAVEGRLQYGQYEKDGVTRYTTDIIVNQLTLLGSGGKKEADKATKEWQGEYAKTANNDAAQQSMPLQSETKTHPDFNDDIPF